VLGCLGVLPRLGIISVWEWRSRTGSAELPARRHPGGGWEDGPEFWGLGLACDGAVHLSLLRFRV
jgi:hypothetical protein